MTDKYTIKKVFPEFVYGQLPMVRFHKAIELMNKAYEEGYEDGQDVGVAQERLENPGPTISLQDMKDKISARAEDKYTIDSIKSKYKPSDFYQYGYNNQFLMHVTKVAELMNQAYEAGRNVPFSAELSCGFYKELCDLRKENEELKNLTSVDHINCPCCNHKFYIVSRTVCDFHKENENLKEENEKLKENISKIISLCFIPSEQDEV